MKFTCKTCGSVYPALFDADFCEIKHDRTERKRLQAIVLDAHVQLGNLTDTLNELATELGLKK